MNFPIKRSYLLFILIIAAGIQACVPGNQLVTRAAAPDDVKGTYTLMLYGCHYPAQVNNVAILVAGNSKYPVEIHDLDTSYKLKKDVPAPQALAEADSFVRCSTYRIWQTQLQRIPDDSGGTIGYEVRPLYVPYEFGMPDVLRISYSLQNGVVRVYIRVNRDVERAIEGLGGDGGPSKDGK
jgi:hypothetical protein